ncbi:hypothetical protein HDV01_006272 [Terramyces sp. JEL0728]|nr:hypothetical protein HDV01_006272 [Terramyces sp. JEL0728]
MASLTIPKASWQAPPNSRITSVTSSKEGDKIVAGMSDGSIIIHKWNDEVVNSFDLFGTWIVAASIRTTEKKDADSMLLLDADGMIHSMILDTTTMKCVGNAKIASFQLPNHIMGNTVDLQINKYDTNIYFVLELDHCQVIAAEATCIGTFPSQDELTLKLCLSSLNSQQQSLISFTTNNLQSVKVKLTNFWASLFGSNMSAGMTGGSEEALTLKFDTKKVINMADLWIIGTKTVQYTTMAALLKKYVAVGFGCEFLTIADGSIAIVPQTTILMEDQNYWMKTAVRILLGHNSSISCLFVPENGQSPKNILLSGDTSGKVIMWNSLSGQTLGTFYNHSQSVTGFVQVPPEVGGKYKTSTLSIARDNSVGLIHLEEKTSVSFVGHKNKICAVYWRTVDHYLMMIHYSTPIVAVALINVKKLIDEMYNGEQILNSQDTSPTGSINGSPAFERAKLAPAPTEKHHNPIHYLQKKLTHTKPEAKVEPSVAIESARGSRPDHVLASNLFSSIISWGIDSELDNICSNELKLSKPHQLTIAGGYLSFPIQQAPTNPRIDWTYSPNLSAQRLLTIIALLRSFVSNYNLSMDTSKLIRQFGTIVDYSSTLIPSFSFLIKFWQDAISDVQEAARFVVSTVLTNSSEEKLQSIVNYWAKFMPLIPPIQSKTSCRATIILALIGSLLPPALPLRVTKDVSTSLELIIRDPGKNPYRLLAIEIIGSGFKSWEPHLNGSSVIRCLVQLTGLTGQQNVQGAPLITPPSMIMARQALLSIANYNTGLFISTLTFDLLHAKDIWERVGGLKLLGLFIAKKPILLFNHLQPMVEAMVKMLDPNHPTVRESLQDIVTVNFADLVKIFPSIAFHPATQRLGVGTVDGSCIIFDLRTATKLNLLEGIRSQAHGISFSPNGKLIATLHLQSNQISFWQPSSGFLESLAGVFSGAQHPKQIGMQLPLGVSRVTAFRTFPLGAPNSEIDARHVLDSVKFHWTGERSVRLISINGLELVFNV